MRRPRARVACACWRSRTTTPRPASGPAPRPACAPGIELVAGVEVTSLWRGQRNPRRRPRNRPGRGRPGRPPGGHRAKATHPHREPSLGSTAAVSTKLAWPASTSAPPCASLEVPTRTHVARELVAAGAVDTVQAAFDRWLARGRPGHVPCGLACARSRCRGDPRVRRTRGAGPSASLQALLRRPCARCWANSPLVGGAGLEAGPAGPVAVGCRTACGPRAYAAASPAPRARTSMSRASRGAPWGASLSYRTGSSRCWTRLAKTPVG